MPLIESAKTTTQNALARAKHRIHRLVSARVPVDLDQAKLWVPSGHFYSPIPDNNEIRRRSATIFPTQLSAVDVPGVDLHLTAQQQLLTELLPLVRDTQLARSREQAREAGQRYWTDNDSYGSGDGLFLSLLLRHWQPQRLVELGSGFSSACTLDARERWLGGNLDVTFVEPFPDLLRSVLKEEDWRSVQLLEHGTQDIPFELINSLGAGDVLFVDSTHVSKTGSDVNWLVFEILPRLASGVHIHIHDIFPRFEYPPDWVYEHRGWNEAYVLRAFLQYNEAFRIDLWPNLLLALDPDRMLTDFPALRINGGGAIWLTKR